MASPHLIAAGNIYPSRFVKIDTTAGASHKGLQADANAKTIGISHPGTYLAPLSDYAPAGYHAIAGLPIGLFGDTDVCLLEAGDTIVQGDRLKSDANGKGVPIATSGTTIQQVGAVALESGAAGELIRVQVVRYSERPALS